MERSIWANLVKRSGRMTYKPFFFIFFLLLSIGNVYAVEINIYYPNNNTTTDMYYSENGEYIYIQNNTINANLTSLIIKNQYESVNIISSPEKILDHTTLLLYIIIFVGIISMLIYVSIRVVKRI